MINKLPRGVSPAKKKTGSTLTSSLGNFLSFTPFTLFWLLFIMSLFIHGRLFLSNQSNYIKPIKRTPNEVKRETKTTKKDDDAAAPTGGLMLANAGI